MGKQKYSSNIKYRKIIYSTEAVFQNALLLYNNLTDELLDFKNAENIEALLTDENLLKYLVEHWFYVPVDFDEVTLFSQYSSTLNLLYNKAFNCRNLSMYTILTTTDCNARCFYCFEKCAKHISMSKSTAADVADFILKTCASKLRIRWFGGEPLYNSEAIDIISARLKENNINYESSMVTNGFLFNDENIEKAKNIWNLKKVQITLDGTEKVYNRIKNYIYKNVNPYKTVISNIENLLKADIATKIRFNMDLHNADDLNELIDYINEHFGNYSGLSCYGHILFDDSSDFHKTRSVEDKDFVLNRFYQLKNKTRNYDINVKYTLDNYLRQNQCMADSSREVVIMPNGNLGKCEHYTDEHLFGNIYSDDFNYENIEYFKTRAPEEENCKCCNLRPACIRLLNCPDIPKTCTDVVRNGYQENLKDRIINTYKDFLKKAKNNFR